MKLETRKYLYDIQYAADLLREFTGGKVSADYEDDAMLRSHPLQAWLPTDRQGKGTPNRLEQSEFLSSA